MIIRTYRVTGEVLHIPGRKILERGKFYNWQTRKRIEDERMADGCVVAAKQRNGCGAKPPY
jgi:hypothetical protein